jgi:peptide/nickel transport system substrate-binding protein
MGGIVADSEYWSHQRLTRRRWLVASSSAVLGLAAASCSAGNRPAASSAGTAGSAQTSAGTPQAGGTLNIYRNINTPLDPQKVSASPQFAVNGVYSRLFRFKTGPNPNVFLDHNVEGDLGVSAESPDALTWTVKLRSDAKFTNIAPVNGHAVEAEDVKATFTRILDPATSSPNRGQLSMVDPAQITTPDAHTVVFKLNYPYAPFNRSLASPAYALILPREALAGAYDPAKVVIGSGPFTLESATPDVAYIYKKNPDYFDKSIFPHVDGIRMAIIPDTNTQLAQFAAGNLDEIEIDDPNALGPAQATSPKAQVVKAANATPTPVFWQLGDPTSVFQDIRVRRAFNMAVDRDAISKALYNGQTQEPVFVPTYMGKWSLQLSDLPADTQQYYKYNPSEAKKLLQAAGANDLVLKYETFNSTAVGNKHGETVNSMLNDAGVKTTYVMFDYNKDYIDSGKGISQGYYPKDMIVFGYFSPYTEADEWLFAYWDSKSVNSHENLKDPKMDAMIDKERTLLDEGERVNAVHDIQKYVAEQVYYLPTLGPYAYMLLQPRVHGYQYSSSLGKFTETYTKLWLSA